MTTTTMTNTTTTAADPKSSSSPSGDAPVSARRRDFDREAMPHLHEAYSMALRLTKDPGDAEDLVQDAFLRAYTRFNQFRSGTNCRAWLFRIVTNTFINGYRRRVKERQILDRYEAGEPAERFFSWDAHERQTNPEKRVVRSLTGEQLRAALDEVPVDFRTVVLLADVHEFSYKEIAEIMGTPVGTVMSRLFRGRRILRRLLWPTALDHGILATPPEDPEDPARGKMRRPRGAPLPVLAPAC